MIKTEKKCLTNGDFRGRIQKLSQNGRYSDVSSKEKYLKKIKKQLTRRTSCGKLAKLSEKSKLFEQLRQFQQIDFCTWNTKAGDRKQWESISVSWRKEKLQKT
ncbi:MAG: hypothetical protein J6B85_13765 [Lachnospiraceae bacterium]|nr:hypothetical protein [Lachnospiraceae bacterium]